VHREVPVLEDALVLAARLQPGGGGEAGARGGATGEDGIRRVTDMPAGSVVHLLLSRTAFGERGVDWEVAGGGEQEEAEEGWEVDVGESSREGGEMVAGVRGPVWGMASGEVEGLEGGEWEGWMEEVDRGCSVDTYIPHPLPHARLGS